MDQRARIGPRAAAGLVAMTLLVTASVGRCDLPQPKLPGLGRLDERPTLAGAWPARPETIAFAGGAGDRKDSGA